MSGKLTHAIQWNQRAWKRPGVSISEQGHVLLIKEIHRNKDSGLKTQAELEGWSQ